MPLYSCKCINEEGNKENVFKDANDEVSLKVLLKHDGYTLISAQVVKEKGPNTFFAVSSKVKLNEIVLFLRQFAVMIKATIPISEALNVLRKQKHTKAFTNVLNKVYFDVQAGVLLSDAFGAFPKVFPKFMVSMIGIAEVSGALEGVLISLADYYENDRKIKRKAKSAMVYPTILFILIVAVSFFVTLFVIPQFEDTINQLGGDIPKLTQVVMNISKFMQDNFIFILFGLIIFIFVIVVYFRTKRGKYTKDWLKLKIPFIKQIEKNLITARFAKAFIILLESGMNITDSMDNLRKMLGNQVFTERFKESIADVKKGKSIATSIEKTKLFPVMLTEMIHIGENTGNMEDVLRSTSGYFDEAVESSVTKATAALEPIMIIFMGGIVAVVILAVLLPIISLMNSI